jgi:hypothetical protein
MKTVSDYARSIRLAGLVILIATASLVQACSSDTPPTAPSSSITSSPVSEPTPIRVSGRVTNDEGVAVAGVKLTVSRWPTGGPPYLAVTDNTGFYSISFVPAAGISVFTEKDGYESASHSHTTSPGYDFQFDLRIHRIRP